MAVIKAVSSKASIGQALDYVTKDEKTEEKLVSGLHCEPESVKAEMQATKELWGKTGGRTYKHFVQSFAPGEKIDPMQAHRLAYRFATEWPEWAGFEVLIATHKDKDHIHTHFVVNSVNYEDGHKLQQSRADLKSMKAHSDRLCMEQGLRITEKGKTYSGEIREETAAWKKETYQLLQQAEKGQVKSYVQEIALAVLDCQETATSREEFIRLMYKQGYGVDWQDSHKYITYTDLARKQAGEKVYKIRHNKLEKYYNMNFGKEELERGFTVNARTEQARKQIGQGTDQSAECEDRGTGITNAEDVIRDARDGLDRATAKEQDSRANRADREIERKRLSAERERRAKEAEREAKAREAERRKRSRKYDFER